MSYVSVMVPRDLPPKVLKYANAKCTESLHLRIPGGHDGFGASTEGCMSLTIGLHRLLECLNDPEAPVTAPLWNFVP